MEIPFLSDLVVIFAVAVAVATASRWVGLPSMAGFLLTGVIIGPSAMSLVRDQHLVEVLAEVGVMALLFTIGLEFSPTRLRSIGRPFLIGGGTQAVSTIAAGAVLGLGFGFDLRDAVFLGFLLTLSSTAIVFKLYGDRREVDAPHGRAVVGILLFQDILLVPMIIVTPALADGVEGGASLASLAARFLIGIGVVAALFGAGRYLLPRLFREIGRTRIREALLLGAIAVGLAMSLLTASLGFSLALGAFLAGMLLAESEYSPQVIADILPLRDVFSSLFFISAGMLLSVAFVVSNLVLVLTVSITIIIVKAAICFLAVRLLAYPNRTALLAGASLAQVGEFSFVLITVGLANGLLDARVYQVFLAAAVITMLATPLLVAAAPVLALRLPPGHAASETEAADLQREAHVIIVGFGLNGRNLAHVLRQAGIPYVILELNGDTVQRAKDADEPILFGDASQLDVLQLAGIDKAEVAVFAISDPRAVRRAVRLARQLNPRLHIIVRTAQVTEIDEVSASGADEVVAEEFEASIEILNRVLRRYDVPANVVEAETKVLRGDGYRLLRSPASAPALSDELVEALAAGTTAVFAVISGAPADGKTILDLDLRRRSGATIIAVVRGRQSHTNPGLDFRLQQADRLVLVGSHAEIREAFDVLGLSHL